jgi:hypothetical protein
MHSSRSALALLAAALWAAGCSPDLKVPPGAEITCSAGGECPEGLFCRSGVCVSVANGDAVAPGVVPLSVTVGPGRIRAGAAVSVAFDVTEPLQANPDAIIDVGGGRFRALTLDAAASSPATLHYVYTYTASGDETEGRTSLLTTDLLDTAGNRSTGIVLGSVVPDFTGPLPSLGTVSLLPGPANPLNRLQAAGPGTEVVMVVAPDELLADAPPPALAVTRAGGGSIPFAYDAASSTGGLATFTATIVPTDLDGDYEATVTWTDLAGNEATRATGTGFTVRTSAPVLAVDQAAIRFVRSPWGSAADEALGAFTVPAGPFFGLAPADTLSGGAALPATTFQLAANRPLVRIRVWSDAALTTLLGHLDPLAGGWERRPLDHRDTPSAWVTGIDDAGNESAPVRIQASEWVATSNPPVGVPVHEITATASVSPALAQVPVGMSAVDAAAAPGRVAAADDDGLTPGRSLAVSSSPRWIATPTSAGELPSARAALRLAYDPIRRRVVLFAGSTQPGSSADAFDDTWEWDGARWMQSTPLGAPPPRREGHVLFYDPNRGTVVLFGGGGDFCLDDLWEWDGARWRPIEDASTSRPINCGRGAGTYDPVRGVLVYWPGENAAVWTWDGARWTEEPGGDAGPTPRRFVDLAYDPVRGAVVLYGGWSTDFTTVFADTWEWDGAWHLRNAASAPGPRRHHRMAWDPLRGRVVLVGGRDATGIGVFADVWAWNGADWEDVTPAAAGPTPRSDHAIAWDDVNGRLMVVGGVAAITGLLPADTWHLGTAGWVAQPSSFARPTQRKNHAMAADPAGGALLFGGVSGNNPLNAPSVLFDTWRYRSPVWTQLSPGASPSARVGHAMATTPTGVALFGGFGPGASPVYRDDLHLWNGSTWVPQPATGGPPAARTGAGLAFDRFRNRLVMFGGSNGAPLGDVWEHDGASWSNRTPGGTSPRPDARAYHGMAYDEDSRRVIVYGGCRNPRDQFARCDSISDPLDIPVFLLDDVWAWDGASWTQLSAGTGLYRGNLAMAWAPPQHRIVVFGGYDGRETFALPAEWDGQWWVSFLDTGAPTTLSAAMAHDATSGRPVLFGGEAGGISAQSWEWDAPPGRQPAVQLTASTAPASIDPATVEEVRVRAVCGGVFAPYAAGSNGAALWGWSRTGGQLGLGGWVRLAANTAGWSFGNGALASPATSRVEWASATPAEAREFLLTSRAVAAFQCRPDGPAVDVAQRGLAPAQGAGEALVAADFLEVRIRYRTP